MKKTAVAIGAALLAAAAAAVAAAPANAVNCNSFNRGTGTAAHVAGAEGQGLYKIASQCH
jgi:hypothetical protein